MTEAVVMAAFVLMLAGGCAFLVVRVGRKHGESERKLRRLRIGFLVGGAIFSAYAFHVTLDLARTTLFETVVQNTGAPGEVLNTTQHFSIEHSGVGHTLLVAPAASTFADAARPVHATVFVGRASGEAWIRKRVDFATTRDARGARVTWRAATIGFTPDSPGEVVVAIAWEEPDVRSVHIRVEDPLKMDGTRAPGY
ncbi:MAG: hypothetical protein R3E84_05305 [Pseudomonadales bacterium]